MTADRTIPILPCADLDAIISFYEALGFVRTFRQLKPNPYTVLARGSIALHFAAIDGFDPANSYGSCLVVTDDANALYAAFSTGMRASVGRLPVAGIPRFTRPRKKLGVVHGFSVVDPGGNWIRVVQQGADAATEDTGKPSGLAKAVLAAARLGDAKGDPAAAATLLDRALTKATEAPVADRLAALVYRAELALALSDPEGAHLLVASARSIPMASADREALAGELQRLAELEADLT